MTWEDLGRRSLVPRSLCWGHPGSVAEHCVVATSAELDDRTPNGSDQKDRCYRQRPQSLQHAVTQTAEQIQCDHTCSPVRPSSFARKHLHLPWAPNARMTSTAAAEVVVVEADCTDLICCTHHHTVDRVRTHTGYFETSSSRHCPAAEHRQMQDGVDRIDAAGPRSDSCTSLHIVGIVDHTIQDSHMSSHHETFDLEEYVAWVGFVQVGPG